MRRSLRSRFLFSPWIRSSCCGLKSDFIRGAVFSSPSKRTTTQHTYRNIEKKQSLTFARSEEAVCERKRDQAGKSEDEEREKLTLEINSQSHYDFSTFLQ